MIRHLFFVFMVFGISFLQAQEKVITGTVSDASGFLSGVNVLVKGTTSGTETDFDGNYSIKVFVGDKLIFNYLGYKSVEKIVGNSSIINVKMIEDENILDEIVVSAYSIKREKKALGFSTSSIKVRGSSSIKGSSLIKLKKPQSGQLTAGEINDIDKWNDWNELKNKSTFLKVEKDWGFSINDKIEVFVKDKEGKAIINAEVFLLNVDNQIIIKTLTDVFGKAVLYKTNYNFYTLQVAYENEVKGLRITPIYKKVDFIFSSNRELSDIDIMFTVDATGSMGDEINYLKSEIENIIYRIDKRIKKKRIGLTFYRDQGDEYVVKDFDFTTNISVVKENLLQQNAGGGGDYEEAVERALIVSLSKSWNVNAKARLLFLLLDAPPHFNKENVAIIKKEIKKAQENGIKIIPIVASDANKTVEYLMRYFSVSTNGTYVFLTDDSGIGNEHLKPTTNDFKVEKLNDLIVRLIEKYAGVTS